MDALLELHIRLPTPKTRIEKFSVFLDSKKTGKWISRNSRFSRKVLGVPMQIVISNSVLRERRTDISDV